MNVLVTVKRKSINKVDCCNDCGIVITNEKKGMKCRKCGSKVCYKCNMGYMCKSCYCNERGDYYKDTEIKSCA